MNSIPDKNVATKLAAARTKLILDKPFLGALVLRLPMVEADPQWCPTSAIDAKRFYYNPDYISNLSIDQVQFVLAHEALHCALLHFNRRQHRQKRRWDVACDYAINPLLLKEGLKAPPGVWVHESYEGMTAEEIYPTIEEANEDEPMDKHVYDGDAEGDTGEQKSARFSEREGTQSVGAEDSESGNQSTSESLTLEEKSTSGASQPPPLNETERQDIAVQWQQRLAGAAQQALQAGKLSGLMARLIEYLLQPQLPWRMLLARYMTMTARDDYTYMRPSRREGAALFPSLRSSQLEVIVAIDTSGSVTDEEMSACIAEIGALKGQLRARITLLACDVALDTAGPWIYEPWEDFIAPNIFHGGGGTCFKPVFDYVERHRLNPDLLVYFTDAEGEFPHIVPSYPVIWLVKGRSPVPFGQRIQLN